MYRPLGILIVSKTPRCSALSDNLPQPAWAKYSFHRLQKSCSSFKPSVNKGKMRPFTPVALCGHWIHIAHLFLLIIILMFLVFSPPLLALMSANEWLAPSRVFHFKLSHILTNSWQLKIETSTLNKMENSRKSKPLTFTCQNKESWTLIWIFSRQNMIIVGKMILISEWKS